ncbi:HEAT repeat domain-containing protein [Terriglobus albidus]|uniref:HEAT repeat domain-containing protein n=1 Tax=Terriglobus albidus TaxID=1592106 RepID=A0A5B9E948_9BACT|nr:HEAT repeat domain-containing protein [Terriglobus albidus]QEE26817.1 HEAT repeat domain-containing protein [Terriglobus albidus]
MRIAFRILVVSLGLVAPLAAQQPVVTGVQVDAHAAHGLPAELSAAAKDGIAWVGYSIPVLGHFSDNDGETLYLEGSRDGGNWDSDRQQFDHVNVLLRMEKGAVTKLRMATPNRKLDTGGVKFVWLEGVSQDESIREFVSLANNASQERKVRDASVMIIAQHESPAATSTLISMATTGDSFVREKAAFWLGAHRGQDGTKALLQLTRTEQDEHLRGKLAFDLTLGKENPAAIDELIWMAKNDASPHVRKEAQFWMAQKAGKRAAGELRQIVQNDPDRSIRRSAVFAISRLPEGEAAAQLIQVAESNKDPDVRKQAIFWLGQSKDPKALDYLTKLLRSN